MARTSIQEIFASFASFPSVGGSNVLYIATDTDTLYRWNGSSYVAIGGGTATTATNLAGGAGGSIPYQSSAGVTAMLANGTAGQVLTSSGTTLAPTWTTVSGFSWGSSITGTTGTGSLLTMGDSYAAGGIGQSIVLGNTQTQALKALSIDTGTASVKHKGIFLTVNNDTFGDDVSGAVVINAYGSATQGVGDNVGIQMGKNFNTNSIRQWYGMYITNEQNAGTGINRGIWIKNNSTDFSGGAGSGINIEQNGVGGTGISLITASNINSSTNGLINYTLSNTQSAATVMQKIDLGTSAQAHTGIYILANNASTSARGIKLDLSTAGTGTALEIISIPTTTGKAFSYNSSGTSTNVQANRSTDFFTIDVGRLGGSAGTWLDAFNVFYIKRTNATDTTGRNLTSSGSVLKLENITTQALGTLADTVAVLSLVQDNDSTGGHILFNAYSGVPLVDGTMYFDGTNFKCRVGGATKTFTIV